MANRINFGARATYLPDISNRSNCPPVERPRDLASAVRMAIQRHKSGEVPVIETDDIRVIGIHAISAVHDSQDFPSDDRAPSDPASPKSA